MRTPKIIAISPSGSLKIQKKDGPYKVPDEYWISQGFAGLPLREHEAKELRLMLVETSIPYTLSEAFEVFFTAFLKLIKTLFTGGNSE